MKGLPKYNDRFAIVMQNYTQREPTYNLYKEERRFFGLYRKYYILHLDGLFGWTATFDDVNELLGRLLKRVIDNRKQTHYIYNKNEFKNLCKDNMKITFVERSCYESDKPVWYKTRSAREFHKEINQKLRKIKALKRKQEKEMKKKWKSYTN